VSDADDRDAKDADQQDVRDADEQDITLPPERVAEMVEAGEAQLVDVREPDEREGGRIEAALHIRLEELPTRAAEIDRERPVVFHCQGGNRSQMAADAFRESGYDAHSLAGGLKAWEERGLPVKRGKGDAGEI
jgi:rhodanese-related sulfurtransferase